MFNLGLLLANRLDPPDLDEARRWYLRAAQAGDADAMFNLGVLLEDRLDWPDLAEARRWYLRAAGAGHANAARRLSRLRVPEDKAGRSRRRRRNQAR
jgi:TPR repeat protein